MKYIRTKDGKIYDNLALRIDEFVYLDEKGLPHREYKLKDITKSILKVADTIEELCDTFIAISKNGVICAYKTFHELKHYEYVGSIELPCSPFIEKYGAIHIKNKGLIYVAKMNEKGELELL